MRSTRQYGRKIDMALSLWVKLARAAGTLSNLAVKDIASYALTPGQFGVIESLGHLGPMKIGELCAKNLSTGGNMTVVVDNLEKEGLVERKEVPGDRRAYAITLTQKGRSLFERIFVQHAKYISGLVHSALTEEEITHLSTLLKKLGLALKENL